MLISPSSAVSKMTSGDVKGYDCHFVDPVPNSLVCLICTLVARAPQQMVCCGKVYCKACLSDLKASFVNATCPQCRKKIESFPDIRGENTDSGLGPAIPCSVSADSSCCIIRLPSTHHNNNVMYVDLRYHRI